MPVTISGNGTFTGTSFTANNIAANTITSNNILSTSQLATGNMPIGSVLQVVYTETAGRSTYNQSGSLNSFDDLNFYADSAKISATITKAFSSSVLRVTAGYSWMYTSGNGLHGFVIWRDSSTKKNFGQDWGRDWTTNACALYREFTAYFTGLSTGSHTFNAVPVRGNNSAPIGFTRNPNQSDMGDNVNTNMTSFVMIEEIAA